MEEFEIDQQKIDEIWHEMKRILTYTFISGIDKLE